MKWFKWIGIVAAIIIVFCCFQTWAIIHSKQIVVSGVGAIGTDFGKPAYFHFVLIPFFIAFSLIPRLWAKRANLAVVALNLAWAIRNYFLVTACAGGECPEKFPAIFIMMGCSVIMLFASFFPDIKIQQDKL